MVTVTTLYCDLRPPWDDCHYFVTGTQPLYGAALRLIVRMRVAHRYADICVPKQLLHGHDVHAAASEPLGEGVGKRVPQAAWTVGIAIAAVFALCHLPKAGITGLADWRHLRDGRRLHLVEDQVEFDDVAVSGALSVQRHHFRGSGAARVK